MAKLSIILRQH